ncbi:hypothetical protein [Actinoplanes sp. NPDC051494]|uniref:hypothetical protein n=1 Tax=Actinoplanes sp. NPDC051494 TaxID=3363907 RepID=UPI0037920AAB
MTFDATTVSVEELHAMFRRLPAAEQAAVYENAGVTAHALTTRAFSPDGQVTDEDALAELLELARAER